MLLPLNCESLAKSGDSTVIYRMITVFITLLTCLNAVNARNTLKEGHTAEPVVISATATSYGENSQSIVCILDPKCNGYWTPKTRDGGINEGIYIQFLEPVEINYVLVEYEEPQKSTSLMLYLDGMIAAKSDPQKGDAEKIADTEQEKDIKEDNDCSLASSFPVNSQKAIINFTNGKTAYFDLIGKGSFQPNYPVCYSAKSLFLKIRHADRAKPVKIRSIRFIKTNNYDDLLKSTDSDTEDKIESNDNPESDMDWGETVKLDPDLPFQTLRLPLIVGTKISASSVLEPITAYQPALLFDSNLDMAWSTNGKKTKGINESITLEFDQDIEIKGFMIWNGYQRSEAHYKANGRVRILDINGEPLTIEDQSGLQTLLLKNVIKGKKVVLTIKSIYKGLSYTDVLISELRLLGSDGQIIMPSVQKNTPKIPAFLEPIMNQTFTSFINGQVDEYGTSGCHTSTVNFRSDGTFVIYTEATYQTYSKPGVIEGNWELLKQNRLRIFGKKYHISIAQRDGYLTDYDISPEDVLTAPKIFQSFVTINEFNKLPPKKQTDLLNFIIARNLKNENEQDTSKSSPCSTYGENEDESCSVTISLKDFISGSHEGAIRAKTQADLIKNMRKEFTVINPQILESDVYTELLVQNANTSICSEGP